MSEEEKQAYDNLIMLRYFTMEKEDKDSIGIIIKFIEKQQKEIEDLKDVQQQICNEELLTQEYVQNNYIRKDKIREKMKHYQELYKEDNSPNDFLIGQNLLSKLSALQELLGE